MADKIVHHCDFCGNPTRRPAVAGERLCQRCAREDIERIAERRRQWSRRISALGQAVDLAYKNLPQQCGQRIHKAITLAHTNAVVLNGKTARVRSAAGQAPYIVDAADGCDCPDAHGAPLVAVNGHEVPACKHQIAVWLERKINQLLEVA